MKSKMFALALFIAAGTALAQQNTIVDNLPGTFVDISGLGANTLINGLRVDDVSFPITTTVTNSVFAATSVHVCSNGYMQFDAGTGANAWTNATIVPGTNSPVAPNTAQALFPFWDDQLIPAGHGGEIYWMEGTAVSFGLPAALGNVLIVQWNGVPHYNAGAAVGAATYQVQIYQNVIDHVAAKIIYNDISYDDARFDNGVSATIGYAAGTTGGSGSSSNVLYSFNTAGAVQDGDVLSVLANTAPSPPAGIGSAEPGTAIAGDTIVFQVTVTPGFNPVSTGVTVVGNLSSIGGSATAAFHDDGLNGDATAGDNIYSYSYLVPASAMGGNYSIPVAIADAQARNGSTAIVGNIFNPIDLGQIGAGAGGTEVVTTIDVPVDAPADIIWYKFSIGTDVLQASTNYLDIDTEPSADDGPPAVGSINDTELGIYMTDGTLIANDDDSGSSYHTQLTFGDNTNARPAFGNGTAANGRNGDLAAGTYYLASGLFNMTFAANFAVTAASATAAGTFQINFRTNIPGGGTGPICGAADLGGVGGIPGADNHLDNNDFVVFIDFFFNHNALADQGGIGGTPGADGVWDNNDFVVFIDNFFTAPASCR